MKPLVVVKMVVQVVVHKLVILVRKEVNFRASHPGAADVTTPSANIHCWWVGISWWIVFTWTISGSGGGGATQKGHDGGPPTAGAGGNGATYSILGSPYVWAGGGGGGDQPTQELVMVAKVVRWWRFKWS